MQARKKCLVGAFDSILFEYHNKVNLYCALNKAKGGKIYIFLEEM